MGSRGFGSDYISQLVHEFVVLRRVLFDIVQKHDPELCPADTDLTELLDSAIGVAVQSYVDARDFEMRRAQAANIGFLIHELRQPLSTALLTSASLRTRAVSEQLPKLDALERNLRRIAELINSVLLTEKLEAGEVQLQLRETTLGELMEPVESLRKAAERKGLRLRATYDPELTVVVDPTLTRSVIQNLVENAVKYTDHGVIDVSVTQARDEIVLNVCDTCQGLSREELLTIFEPFKRGRTNKSGTGLGLAIVRRAVEAQGGRIHAESPGPSGCRFTEAAALDPTRSAAAKSQNSVNASMIVVVDAQPVKESCLRLVCGVRSFRNSRTASTSSGLRTRWPSREQ